MLFYRQKSKVQDKTSGRVGKGPKREKTGMRQAPAGWLTDHTGGRCERRTPTPRGEKTRSGFHTVGRGARAASRRCIAVFLWIYAYKYGRSFFRSHKI